VNTVWFNPTNFQDLLLRIYYLPFHPFVIANPGGVKQSSTRCEVIPSMRNNPAG
jgi:hypothetical protein